MNSNLSYHGQDTLIDIGTSYGKFVVMQTFHDALIAMRALIWQGHVHFIQGWSPPLKVKTVWNARYGDLNSDLPVCLSTGLEEITPS